MFSPFSCYIRANPQTSHWTRHTLYYVGGTRRHPGCVFKVFFNHISCHVQFSLTQYDAKIMLCLVSGNRFLKVPFSTFNQIKLYPSLLTADAYANVHFNGPILLKWAHNILLVVLEHVHWFLICQCKIRHFGRAKSIVVWKRVGYGESVCVSHRGRGSAECSYSSPHEKCSLINTIPTQCKPTYSAVWGCIYCMLSKHWVDLTGHAVFSPLACRV